VAGSARKPTNKDGRVTGSKSDKGSVDVQRISEAMIVHGSSENELDFPWHLSALSKKTQRLFFFSTVVFDWQLSESQTGDSVWLQQDLVVWQHDFLVSTTARDVAFAFAAGVVRTAYLGGVTPLRLAQSSRSSGVWQQQLVQHWWAVLQPQ
jgi:hypothetical protein